MSPKLPLVSGTPVGNIADASNSLINSTVSALIEAKMKNASYPEKLEKPVPTILIAVSDDF